MADEIQIIKKKLTDVDYIDSLNNSGSFFVNQSNTVRQINKEDVVFGIKSGGTGAKNAEDARANLGLGSVATMDVVPIENGGLGATNRADARIMLGLGEASVEDVVPMEKGGTDATDGATGLMNLFASGGTVLTEGLQYGDSLTDFTGNLVEGTIFFVKV